MERQELVEHERRLLQEALRQACTHVDKMRQFNQSPPGGGKYYDLSKRVADLCREVREMEAVANA